VGHDWCDYSFQHCFLSRKRQTILTKVMACTDTSQAQFDARTPESRVWEVKKKPSGCSVHDGIGSDQRGDRYRVVAFPITFASVDGVQLETAKRVILMSVLERAGVHPSALAIIFIPVIASMMRLCEIVMSGSPSDLENCRFEWVYSLPFRGCLSLTEHLR
jgi:hypothetical protein